MFKLTAIALALTLAGCFSSGDGSDHPDAEVPPCPPTNEAGVLIDPNADSCSACVDGHGNYWPDVCPTVPDAGR